MQSSLMQSSREYSVRLAFLRTAIVLSVLALAACSSDDDDGGGSDDNASPPIDMAGTTVFATVLSSSQQVPPLNVEGAAGAVDLTFDTVTGAVSGTVTATGPATAAHIHLAAAGSNGPPIVTLVKSDTDESFSPPADDPLSQAEIAALENGELYVNVHTEANVGGEVRAQLIPAGVLFSQTELSGDKQIPVVVTTGSAQGITTVVEASGEIRAAVFTTGLETADAAHIHTGTAAESGDVLLDLVADADGVWRTQEGALLDAAGIAAFKAGGLYFNVHTPDNAAGEVRGQL
ncbi:MAG: CHRD domain-containing protein [Granulosicoccus sp.]